VANADSRVCPHTIVTESVCNKAKNVKSHVFGDFEKALKTLKKRKVLETTQSVFVL